MSKDRLIIFDTTLRDGEQSPGCSMKLTEKVALARQLERPGVVIIEAMELLQNPGAADVACVHGQVTAPYDLEDVRAQVPMRVRYDGHADGAGSC